MAKEITLKEIEALNHKALSVMLHTMSQKNQEIHAKLEKLLLSANPKELVKVIKKTLLPSNEDVNLLSIVCHLNFHRRFKLLLMILAQ